MTACNICIRNCDIADGGTGKCGLYSADGGRVTERFPDLYLAACPISVETMPILHLRPGAKFLQISTVGCNLNCPGCISTLIVRGMKPGNTLLSRLSPEEVADRAVENGCAGIVFLMNDPLASFHTFIRVAREAKKRGLMVGCSSNSLFTEAALTELIPNLDFINIGMKGTTDAAYRACGAPGIGPVLENMKTLHLSGVHVEVSCMLRNDNRDDIRSLAGYVAGLSKAIPFQVMRFLPFDTADISLEPSIAEAEEFCRNLRDTLDFVYLFNSPGTRLLDTRCPECGSVVMKRDFYGPMGARLLPGKEAVSREGCCMACGRKLEIKGGAEHTDFRESGFEGGYPFTRALEMVEAMLIAVGVTRKEEIVAVWDEVLRDGGLYEFHHDVQKPVSYISALRRFGRICGAAERAESLAAWMEERLAVIETAVGDAPHRPRVYYTMGTPLFALNSGRLENRLVELAGGTSVNRMISGEGRPGQTLSTDMVGDLNPDVIFISAFLSSPVDAFLSECRRLELDVPAVRNRRVYLHPSPGWDFGSPRWILGLTHMASVLHPDRCDWDVTAVADDFYRRFYGIPFSPESVNRSFSRPSRTWRPAQQ